MAGRMDSVQEPWPPRVRGGAFRPIQPGGADAPDPVEGRLLGRARRRSRAAGRAGAQLLSEGRVAPAPFLPSACARPPWPACRHPSPPPPPPPPPTPPPPPP